jgi:preprotein translocase subunit SecE
MNFTFRITALPKGVISFVREARHELQTVQWPSRRETVRSTILILLVSAAVALATGALDAGLTVLIERVLL